MAGKGHALLERIREVRKAEESAGPDRGWRMLRVVAYECKKWSFDERLRQLRNARNPYDSIDLNDFEVEYFRKRKKVGGDTP